MAVDSRTQMGGEPSDDDAPEALPAGTVVGRYVVSSVLGHGGMGRVYEAWDENLERRIALKVLRPDVFTAGRQGQRRLLREAQALARVAHPNVVPVFDVGRFEGRIYVAMEHVQGETLRVWMSRSPSWSAVVDIFVRVADGLHAVHEMGLVHRDFKPGNVMLGSDGRPRVMDFGLARACADHTGLQEAASDTHTGTASASSTTGRFVGGDPLETSLTVAGTAVGTPPYMAPEQHHGQAIDARADQYAYCVTLFEALCGRRPFEADDVDELARRKSAGPPNVPAGSQVPPWLVAILRRGLQPPPDARFASMRELSAALERGRRPKGTRAAWLLGAAGIVGLAAWMGPPPTTSCSDAPSPIDAVWNDARADALQAKLAGTGRSHAAATGAHLRTRAEAWTTAWRAEARRQCEAGQAVAASSRECLDHGLHVLDVSLAALDDASPDDALDGAPAALAGLPDPGDCWRARSDAIEPPAPEHVDEVAAIRALLDTSDAQGRLGRYDAAAREADDALERARALGYAPLVAEALVVAARATNAGGDPTRAVEMLREAALGAQSIGHDEIVASAAAELVRLLATTAPDFEQADQWARVGQSALARGGLGESARIRLVHSIAVLDLQRDALEPADAGFREVLAHVEEARDPDPVRIAFAVQDLARTAARRGATQDARDHTTRSLALLEAELGPEHPELADGLIFAGSLANAEGDLEGSIALHRRALAIRETSYGIDHPAVAHALGPLAYALVMHGDLEEAIGLQRRELSILEAALGPDHLDCAIAHGGIGISYDQMKQHEEAAAHHRRALEIFEVVAGPMSSHCATAHNNLAIALDELGRREEARTHYQRSLEIHEALLGKDHPQLERVIANLAWLDHLEGNDAAAREKLERAIALLDVPSRPEDRELVVLLLEIAELALDGGDAGRARSALDRLVAVGVDKVPPPEQPRFDELRERLAAADGGA